MAAVVIRMTARAVCQKVRASDLANAGWASMQQVTAKVDSARTPLLYAGKNFIPGQILDLSERVVLTGLGGPVSINLPAATQRRVVRVQLCLVQNVL